MLEELKWWEFILLVAATFAIFTTILRVFKYLFRKNRPILSPIHHSFKRNYLVFTIITNVDYAVTIENVHVKLTKWKSKKLGFGHTTPNNEIHSDQLSLSEINAKIQLIKDEGKFNVYLPKDFKPENYKFIVNTDAGKAKKICEV